MNIDNLYEGQEIKNYKELCNLIEEKPKGGHSKEAQLKELKRFINYHNEGHKFIIDEVYEIPIKKEDKRTNGLYIDDIQALLMNLLYDSKEKKILLSSSRLFKELNLTNDNYVDGRNNMNNLCKVKDIDINTCSEFYKYTQTSLKQKIESALNGLKRECLIEYKKIYMIVINEVKMNELNQPIIYNGDRVEIQKVHREAEDNEINLILECKQKVLEGLGYKNISQIIKNNEWKTYRERVNTLLKQKGNIEYYYEAYSIYYNNDYIKRYIKRYDLEDVIKERLNDNICTMVKNYAIGKAPDKAKEEVYILLGGNETNLVDKYLSDIDILIDTVIDDEARDIRDELKKGLNPDNIIEEEVEELDFNSELPF